MSQDYKFIRLIGNSSFSSTTVHLAQDQKTLTSKAIRKTDLEKCSLNCINYLQKELWSSRALNHSNILTHQDAFIEKRNLFVVTEFMSYGACSDLLESHFHFGLPEAFISYVIGEVLQALIHIHRLGFIHRGVKSCHILVSGDGRVKLSGSRNMISMLNNEQRFQNVHDFPKHDTLLLPWLSPEILQQNMEGYDTKSDIYSLGITACELANGHAPFTDMPCTQMLLEKLNGTKPCLLDCSTVTANDCDDSDDGLQMQEKVATARQFSDSFHQFSLTCLTHSPAQRPSASELLHHTFITQNKSSRPDVQKMLHPLVPVTPDMQDKSSSVDGEYMLSEQKQDWSFDCEWLFDDD